MLFAKSSSELNNHSMQPGETLFQYLKRKKHFQLKKSLQNSFHKNSLTPNELTTRQQPPNPPKSTENIESAPQASTKRRGKKSSNKKKKIDQSNEIRKQNNSDLSNLRQDIFKNQKTTRRSLADTDTQKIFEQKCEPAQRKIPARSFMSMISPLKNQVNLQHSPYSRRHSLNNTHEKKSIKKVVQINSKKVIKQAMTKVQRYCHNQIDFEKQIKEKMRQLFVLLNSVLIQLDDSAGDLISDGLQRKIKEIKSSMKLINGYVLKREGNEKEDIAQLIEEMYVSVNQIWDSFEGQVKQSSQSNCQSIILRKQQQYEQTIEILTKERNDLKREVNSQSKDYNKLERQHNQLLEKYNVLQDSDLQKRQDSQQRQNEHLQSLHEQIETLSEDNARLTNKITTLDKKLKDSEYKFEEYTRRVHIEHQQKITERQNYLLRQINLLKAECAKDITNLNKFYSNRQETYPKKIKELQKIISDQLATMKNIQEALKSTQKVNKLQEANVKESKRKVLFYLSQIDEVMEDLYRINEELYKHWLALKDIKTLLTRINMFDKFQRIFKDIPFDDVLFLP